MATSILPLNNVQLPRMSVIQGTRQGDSQYGYISRRQSRVRQKTPVNDRPVEQADCAVPYRVDSRSYYY